MTSLETPKPPRLEPSFGCGPHTPGRCGELDEHSDPRREKRDRNVFKPARVDKGTCKTCGGRVSPGMVCMGCHRVPKGMEAAAARHGLPGLTYDRRYGQPKPKKKATPKPKGKPRLTVKERRGLLKDAEAGEHPLPIVKAFLDGLESSAA